MKLNGKSVVVTGASSGMGKAIVERFVQEGANIIAVALQRLSQLFQPLSAAGNRNDIGALLYKALHNGLSHSGGSSGHNHRFSV